MGIATTMISVRSHRLLWSKTFARLDGAKRTVHVEQNEFPSPRLVGADTNEKL